jgi:hypothetical protein
VSISHQKVDRGTFWVLQVLVVADDLAQALKFQDPSAFNEQPASEGQEIELCRLIR